jgi:hypothetical protein
VKLAADAGPASAAEPAMAVRAASEAARRTAFVSCNVISLMGVGDVVD